MLALCTYALVVVAVLVLVTGLILLRGLTANFPELEDYTVVLVLQFAASVVGALAIAGAHFLFARATLQAALHHGCERCELRRTSMKRSPGRMST